ncbi:MAG: glycosyltransferase family 39 protein [Elusimicrobia bacterium]|nr:glycosyltransferase family 39 protein [Elusimicrobiota bacterium]
MAKNKNRPPIQTKAAFIEKVVQLKPLIPGFIIFSALLVWGWVISRSYFEQYKVNLDWLNYVLSVQEFNNPTISSFFGVFGDYLLTAILVIWFYISAFGVGEKIRGLFKVESENKYENLFFSIGFGISVIIYGTFFIGLAGGLYKQFFVMIFIALGIFGIFELKKFHTKHKNVLNQPKKPEFNFVNFLLVIVLFIAGLVTLVTALTPETFYDSTQYHLGVPLIWIQNHRICEIPTIQQSYYQMNMHILYVISILLKYSGLAKLLNYSFGLFSAVLVYIITKKYFSKKAGLLAVALFCAAPIVMFVSSRSCIELPMTFFELLGLFAIFNWINSKKDRWFFAAAIFSGMALASKLTSVFGVISLIFAVLMYYVIYRRQEILHLLKIGSIFLLICFALVSPWLLKNYILIGNPIFPFKLDLAHFQVQQVSKNAITSYIDQAPIPLTIKNIVTIPWNTTMGKYQESFSGAAFLLLIPFLFFFKKTNKLAKIIFFYCIPYYLFWIVIGRCYLRFLITPLAFLSIVLAYYVTEAAISNIFKNIIALILIVFFGTNMLLYMFFQKMSQNPLGVVFGMQSKMEYLFSSRQSYPSPYYQVIDWVNNNLPQDAKIAFFGETRPYYAQRRVLAHSAGDFNQVILWCKKVNSADELREKLAKERVTHIMFNAPEGRRLNCYDIFQFEPKDLEIFSAFWEKYLKMIYAALPDASLNDGRRASKVPEFWAGYQQNPFNYVYLYEILSPEDVNRPRQAVLNFFLYKNLYEPKRQVLLGPTIEKLIKAKK